MARKKKEKDKKRVKTLFDRWGMGTISLKNYEATIKGWKYGEDKGKAEQGN